MPQIDIDGANSKISADKIEGQSGTTVTVTAGHNLAGSGSGLTALNATNLASGTVPTARLGSGTASSSTFLRGDSTYAVAGGGAWTLIGAQNISGSPATVDQTGMDSSTYAMFCIVVSSVVPTGSGSNVQLLLGDSSGIDDGGSDYARHNQFSNANSGSYGTAPVSESTSVIMIGVGVGNAASYGVSAILYVSHGVGTNAYPMVTGHATWRDSGGNYVGGSIMAWRHAAITLDRCRIQGGSSLASGNLAVYGLNLS